MAPTIRVDDEVFAALQKRAKPFVDTPNSVLRRLFRLDGRSRRIRTAPPLPSLGPRPEGTDPGAYRPLGHVRVRLGEPPPSRLRLPNGELRALKHWNSLPLETARYLVEVGKLHPGRCPVQLPRARKRYLIDSRPRHPSGERFIHPIEISDGLWLEAHANAPDLHGQTVGLIRQLGDDPDSYSIGRS